MPLQCSMLRFYCRLKPSFVCTAVHYVAMTPEGRVFDSSLEKGYPYQVRVGAGQVGWRCIECMLLLKDMPLLDLRGTPAR